MEDLNVRRRMETSDLPKLSKRFEHKGSLMAVAWKVYVDRAKWLYSKFSLLKLKDSFDTTNPLISVFTWSVMVPVGGTFSSKV
jgi:hypothetical protein